MLPFTKSQSRPERSTSNRQHDNCGGGILQPSDFGKHRRAGSFRRAGRSTFASDDRLQCLDARRIELTARLRDDLGQRRPCTPWLAIWPRLGHRVKAIRDRDDPGPKRNLLAHEPVGISLSVRALVVRANNLEHMRQIEEPREQ